MSGKTSTGTGSAVRTFRNFTKIPNSFYGTIGIQPYQEKSDQKQSKLLKFIFYFGIINLNLCVVGEFIYLYFAIGSFSTFLEVTALAPCIGFCLVADFKMLAVWWNKKTLSQLMQDLTRIFPNTSELQVEFNLIENERKMSAIMIPFSVSYMILIWTFNLMPLAVSAWQYFFMNMKFKRELPYLIWYPFDATSLINFPLAYIGQVYAGYVAAAGTLSADLLLCCVTKQLCMHFDLIAKRIQEFIPTANYKENSQVIKEIIKHHITSLQLSEKINEIFSISLFLNFLTSSVIICLVGFQVTAGVNTIDFIKYIMFLITSLAQVFMICYYGSTLIDSSLNVSDAAYNQDWLSADTKYKKMLIFIIQRSQKPVTLRAPNFPPISLHVFSHVISMSYQFFALLRTMYSDG